MKRLLLALLGAAAVVTVAYAIQPTPTPIIGGPAGTETGEESLPAASVLNMARFKPGQCAPAAVAVAGGAATVTCNGASGIISLTAATAGASGVTPTVVTVNNTKAQGVWNSTVAPLPDGVQCTVDQTGVTAGAVLICSPRITASGVLTLTILNGSATAMTASAVRVVFLITTSGNVN